MPDYPLGTPVIEDRWVRSGATELHSLVRTGHQGLTPVVYVPGSLGNADDFREEMNALAPRTTIAVSPRGLGRSSPSPSGYSFHHRIADLETLINDLHPEPFCLMAYSLAVPIVIGYAARHPKRVKGLLLLDYAARYPKRSTDWLQQALPFAQQRGIPEHVVRQIQQESELIELWDELTALQLPILLVKGAKSNAVSPDDLQRYRALPQVQIEIFEESGHEIHRPDYQRFLSTIQDFLAQLDATTE